MSEALTVTLNKSSIADIKIKSKNLLRAVEVADNSDLQEFQEFVREVNERRAELKALGSNGRSDRQLF
jgi:hypothetical protein